LSGFPKQLVSRDRGVGGLDLAKSEHSTFGSFGVGPSGAGVAQSPSRMRSRSSTCRKMSSDTRPRRRLSLCFETARTLSHCRKLAATKPPSGGLTGTRHRISPLRSSNRNRDDELGRALVENVHRYDEGRPRAGLLAADGGVEVEIPDVATRWLGHGHSSASPSESVCSHRARSLSSSFHAFGLRLSAA